MAFVLIPLSMLLFGIVIYGYLMSFRQNMTQAAAEGARAGAVVPPDSPGVYTTAINKALTATGQAVGSFGQTCGQNGMTCGVTVGPCSAGSSTQCLTVKVTYDYKNHPLMPSVPLASKAIPDTFVSKSVLEART